MQSKKSIFNLNFERENVNKDNWNQHEKDIKLQKLLQVKNILK